VLEDIAAFAQWPLGREMVLSLRPKASCSWILKRLKEVSQAKELLQEDGEQFHLEHIPEIAHHLDGVRPKGSTVSGQGAWEVFIFLREVTNIKERWQERDRFALLTAWIKRFRTLEMLLKKLGKAFDSSGNIRDDASPDLLEIRSYMDSTKREIMSSLQKLLAKPQLQSLFRDRFITIRNGRYVIPVKAGSVHRIGGVVQDHSTSGDTAFLEPHSVVPLNNRLVAIERREEKEIQRILRGLAEEIRKHRGALAKNRQILGHMDLTFTKARWALQWQARAAQRELQIRRTQIGQQLEGLRATHRLQQERLQITQQALQIATANYQAGLITNLEYLNAQKALVVTQVALNETRLAYALRLIESYALINDIDTIKALQGGRP